MAGQGPSYISSHSADVILSDIRPIKLQVDALRCINVLLDEFLYNVLNAARSLSTDKLRAGLLKVLPTSLGKDALLEAEVELRAYWDRTGPDNIQHTDDQGKTFHLQWSFELLRLKCEAYSTLNESDEDPEAETRLQTRLSQGNSISAPKPALVAPASLYLTAILESLCEHVLSNVGRVAARDSSRTSATVQDLFVALCEDDSIYGVFKSMKVYEQVETLSKSSKPRRSKSSSRLAGDYSTFKDSSRRTSTDSSVSMATAAGPPGLPGSRASFDKSKTMKMFNRSSTDRDGLLADNQRGHKKTDSVLSDVTSRRDGVVKPLENAAMLQEFDNLMRSDQTMKVSLTPDRLKSMDVLNKEKGQRSGRQVFSSESRVEPDPPSLSRAIGRRPSLRHVDSIVEDDEESNSARSPSNRNRQVVTSPTGQRSTPPSRIRSSSASHPPSAASALIKKSSRSELDAASPPVSSALSNIRRRPVPKDLDTVVANDSVPNRKPVPDSRGLDDLTGQSDDEVTTPPPKRRTGFAVSADTRDLINFLSEGPPEDPPPVAMYNHSSISLENGKAKGSGRLLKMMSKLSIGGSSEKPPSRGMNGSDDLSRKGTRKTPPTSPSTPSQSIRGMIPAVKPIPPPPPRPPPISPPNSSQESLPDAHSYPHSSNPSINRSPFASDQRVNSNVSIPNSGGNQSPGYSRELNGDMRNGYKRNANKPQPDSTSDIRNGIDSHHSSGVSKRLPVQPNHAAKEARESSQLSLEHTREMHRLFLTASTADECRLILEMFLAKSGIAVDPSAKDIPLTPLPSPSTSKPVAADRELEQMLVEALLGSGSDRTSFPQTIEPEVAPPSPPTVTTEPTSIVAAA